MPFLKIYDTTATRIASLLLQIKAIQLKPKQPFTWASGWKSPIYCDNRLSLSYPAARSEIKQSLVDAVIHHYPKAEGIAGVATAGIAQGALVADEMNLPFAYVRPKPKDHGLKNQIEGQLKKGTKIVVVEDLVSTGASSLQAVEALRAEGIDILGMVSIFTYGFDVATSNFTEANVNLVSLTDYTTAITLAVKENYITEADLVLLKSWRYDPANWKV